MPWTVLAMVVALWMLGLVARVGGGMIHLLLVVAAVLLLIQLFTGRRVAG